MVTTKDFKFLISYVLGVFIAFKVNYRKIQTELQMLTIYSLINKKMQQYSLPKKFIIISNII